MLYSIHFDVPPPFDLISFATSRAPRKFVVLPMSLCIIRSTGIVRKVYLLGYRFTSWILSKINLMFTFTKTQRGHLSSHVLDSIVLCATLSSASATTWLSLTTSPIVAYTGLHAGVHARSFLGLPNVAAIQIFKTVDSMCNLIDQLAHPVVVNNIPSHVFVDDLS